MEVKATGCPPRPSHAYIWASSDISARCIRNEEFLCVYAGSSLPNTHVHHTSTSRITRGWSSSHSIAFFDSHEIKQRKKVSSSTGAPHSHKHTGATHTTQCAHLAQAHRAGAWRCGADRRKMRTWPCLGTLWSGGPVRRAARCSLSKPINRQRTRNTYSSAWFAPRLSRILRISPAGTMGAAAAVARARTQRRLQLLLELVGVGPAGLQLVDQELVASAQILPLVAQHADLVL